MFDLNLNAGSADSTQNGERVLLLDKFPEGSWNQMAESGTSNSSVVNADGSSNGGGDEDSCSTRADEAFTFNFGILKVEQGRNDAVTKELFPANGANGVDGVSVGNWKGTSSFGEGNGLVDFSFERQGVMKMEMVQVEQQQKQPAKKSRRGPRSRSSQYRGVHFMLNILHTLNVIKASNVLCFAKDPLDWNNVHPRMHAKEVFNMNEGAYTKLRKLWMWPKNLYRGRVKLYLD